jgi:hypothetical protein
MPTTTPTILDQISAEKTKISERLARLDADRAQIATQLIDLEPELKHVVNSFDPWARDRGEYYQLDWKARPDAADDQAFRGN